MRGAGGVIFPCCCHQMMLQSKPSEALKANSVGAHILGKVSNTIFEIKRLLNIHSYYSYRYFLDIISAEHQCLS